MVEKCTNPVCSASFLHLAEGKLFRLDTGQTVDSSDAKATEYFWLCEPCSERLTLRLGQDGRVMATELRQAFLEAVLDGPEIAVISANRENGALLRPVSFLPRSHPRGT
jgi:hypothetical protein